MKQKYEQQISELHKLILNNKEEGSTLTKMMEQNKSLKFDNSELS